MKQGKIIMIKKYIKADFIIRKKLNVKGAKCHFLL